MHGRTGAVRDVDDLDLVASSAAVLRVDALGPLQARRDDAALDLGGPRQRSVLARLVAAGGEVVSTDRLLDDLWHGEPPPRALAALQVHVSHLRRALEPDRPRRAPASVLISAPPGYALRLPTHAVDVWRFEDLLHRAAEEAAQPDRVRALVTQALGCWSGDAYAEFATAAWAVPEVARLHELRLSAVERRAAADLACGAPARAVPDLERHLHDHPLREEAARLLTLALYASGRQGDALSLLRRVRQRLADELGVDPGPALRALEADVLSHAPELPSPAPSVSVRPPEALTAAPSGTPGHTRALGRDGELATLLGAAEQALHGARTAWVSGEAGAGKTTLAEALAAGLAAQGWHVVWGRCPEVDGAPPGWAWSEVGRALTDLVRAGAGTDGPVVRLDGPDHSRPDAPFWLARDVVDRAGEAAAQRPLLVLLEDLHRADGVTLQLLRHVAGDLTGLPVLLVGTLRPSEAGDDLLAALAALAAVTAARVPLTGLGRDGVAALAREAGLADVDQATVDLLSERTGGNPLFVRELARLLAAEGRRASSHAVPAAVREVLRRRVARLPAPAQSVLRRAAVLGRDVDVDELVAVDGGAEEGVVEALELAVLTGLLVEPSPGVVRFAHALVRDTLYDDMPLLRRVRLHAAALAVLQRRSPDDLAALAHHAAAGATPSTAAAAAAHVTAAAGRAEQLGAHGEAARLWGEVVRLHDLAGLPEDQPFVTVLCALVASRARTGDVHGARTARERGLAAARRSGGRSELQRVLASWDAPVIYSIREDRRVDAALVDALWAALDDAALAPHVRSRLLVSLVFELEGGDDEAAREASAQALLLARGGADARGLCAALGARLFLALGPDLAVEHESLAHELLMVATQAGEDDHATLAHFHLFLAAAARADLVGARRQADLALERAATGQLALLLGVVTLFAAVLAVLAGRLDEARAVYDAVAARLDEAGAPNAADLRLLGRVVVGVAAGDLSDLVEGLSELDERNPGALEDALVLALLDAGRPDEARARWGRRAPVLRDYHWLAKTTLRARAAALLGDRGAALVCYDELLPYAGRLAGLDSGSVVLGSVDAALAGLAEVLGRADAAAVHAASARVLERDVARAATQLR